MNDKTYNIRKSNAPPLVWGKPKALSSKLEAQSSMTRGRLLLYPNNGCWKRGRGDPPIQPVDTAQRANSSSVDLCMHSELSPEVSGQVAVKYKIETTGNQDSAEQHRAMINPRKTSTCEINRRFLQGKFHRLKAFRRYCIPHVRALQEKMSLVLSDPCKRCCEKNRVH